MGGRTTISATVNKGMEAEEQQEQEQEAWFHRKEQERSSANKKAFSEAISIRVIPQQMQQQQQQEFFTMFARKSSDVGGGSSEVENFDDDEDAAAGAGRQTFCCFPSSRGRYNKRKTEAAGVSDAATGVLRSLRSLCSCCGSRTTMASGNKWIVEVRGVEKEEEEHGDGHGLRTAERWEVDVNSDEYFFKPPPLWKQMVRKMKAQASRHVHRGGYGGYGGYGGGGGGRSHQQWLNYDPQSYEKNFDNGDKETTALHTALLQRFASTRSQQDAAIATTTTSHAAAAVLPLSAAA